MNPTNASSPLANKSDMELNDEFVELKALWTKEITQRQIIEQKINDIIKKMLPYQTEFERRRRDIQEDNSVIKPKGDNIPPSIKEINDVPKELPRELPKESSESPIESSPKEDSLEENHGKDVVETPIKVCESVKKPLRKATVKRIPTSELNPDETGPKPARRAPRKTKSDVSQELPQDNPAESQPQIDEPVKKQVRRAPKKAKQEDTQESKPISDEQEVKEVKPAKRSPKKIIQDCTAEPKTSTDEIKKTPVKRAPRKGKEDLNKSDMVINKDIPPVDTTGEIIP